MIYSFWDHAYTTIERIESVSQIRKEKFESVVLYLNHLNGISCKDNKYYICIYCIKESLINIFFKHLFHATT